MPRRAGARAQQPQRHTFPNSTLAHRVPRRNSDNHLDDFSIPPLHPIPDALPSALPVDGHPRLGSLLVSSALVGAPSGAPPAGITTAYPEPPRFRLPPLMPQPDSDRAQDDPVLDAYLQRQPLPTPRGLVCQPLPPLPSAETAQRRHRSSSASSSLSSSSASSPTSSTSPSPSLIDQEGPIEPGTHTSAPYLHYWSAFDHLRRTPALVQAPPLAALSDHAFLAARAEHSCHGDADISQALLEYLDPIPAPSTLLSYRPAPCHSLPDVLTSLLSTVATASTSALFHWDEATLSFHWSHTLQRRADEHAERRSAQRRKRRASKRTHGRQPEIDEAASQTKVQWWGTEHIQGWTQQASDSVVRPFLEVATLLRRIEARLAEVRRADRSSGSTKEAPALAFALDTVLQWLRAQLSRWAETRAQGRGAAAAESSASPSPFPPVSAAILNAAAELDETLDVLVTLANLLSCSASRLPPLKPLVWLPSASACLTHLHSHLVASCAARASPLSQALLAYLLDRTSSTWRTEVATWMGWPGFASDRTGEMDQELVALTTRDSARASGKWRESKRATPWSGAEIEWALDERGEEDVGYILRPSAVPSFVGLGDARDFLEAGRALRLLKKVAPPGHPLVAAWTLEGEDGGGGTGSNGGTTFHLGGDHDAGRRHPPASAAASVPLPLPTWLWKQDESLQLSAETQARVSKLRLGVARWRRNRTRAATHSQQYSRGRTQSADARLASSTVDAEGGGSLAMSSSSPLLLGQLETIEGSMTVEQQPDDDDEEKPATKFTEAGMDELPDGEKEQPLLPGLEALEDRFARMTRLFDAVPSFIPAQKEAPPTTTVASVALGDDQRRLKASDTAAAAEDRMSLAPLPPDAPQEDLVVYLATYLIAASSASSHSGQKYRQSSPAGNVVADAVSPVALAQLTHESLVAPLQTWSRLINSALISVFFQDLGLATYLETCKRFLLLGSDHFERRITAALFGEDDADGEEGGGDDIVFVASAADSDRPIALSSRLTGEGKWPPTDALLSSSLNSAVLETVGGMRATNTERIRAGARSVDRGDDGAISLALKDLDDRLSFAVIDPGSSSNWTDPKSIAALDWLTLSFHPPPLIAPLLTQLAQTRYQRLWNLLLQLKRVRVALRGCFRRCFGKTAAGMEGWTKGGEATATRFHWTARHFLDVVERYVHEIGIEQHWMKFMVRLDKVRVGVADDGPQGPPSPDAAADADDDDDDADEDENEDEDGEIGMAGAGRSEGGGGGGELKDVFSLARYHERVLDRMLETCFLKERQRRLMKILAEVLQAQLDFCALVASPATAARQKEKEVMALFERHQKRVGMFVRALMIVRERAPSEASMDRLSGHPPALDAVTNTTTTMAATTRRRADLEAEIERQRMELESDLDRLERGGDDGATLAAVGLGGTRRGNSTATGTSAGAGGRRADPIEILLGRLWGGGFYAGRGEGGRR